MMSLNSFLSTIFCFLYIVSVTIMLLIKTQKPVNQLINRFKKYSRWESNPHFRRNWILNPARLPIPPLEQNRLQN